MKLKLYRIKSSNRVCQLFPWLAPEGRPWDEGYERVMIPLNAAEQKGSKKKCHTQIVRRENLELIRESRLELAGG